MPILTDAAQRIASMRCRKTASLSSTSGNSSPDLTDRARRHKDAGVGGIDAGRLHASRAPRCRARRRRVPVGNSLPVRAPPGSRNSSRIGAALPATPSISMSPVAASAPLLDRKACDDDLRGIGVVNADRGFAVRGSRYQSFVERERPDRRGHVAAIGAVIDEGVAHADLRKGVVDIGVRPARRADDADLRQRGNSTAHAVELTAVGIGRAHHLQEDRIPILGIGGQIVLPEHHRLGSAAPHEYRTKSSICHGGSSRPYFNGSASRRMISAGPPGCAG